MCFVLIYCKYFSLPETEIDIYKYLWEKLFENVQDSLKLFVLWDWNKSGSYQWVTRGHCDSSSCIVWKRNSALKGIFDFSEEFCWHPEKCNQIWRVWEVHGNRYDCVWADRSSWEQHMKTVWTQERTEIGRPVRHTCRCTVEP